MSAVPKGEPVVTPMTVAELSPVVVIEASAYDFPWTRGNFVDSLAAGYLARVLRDASGQVVGYFVAMKGVDEMHLLNLTVDPSELPRRPANFISGLEAMPVRFTPSAPLNRSTL